MNFCGESRWRKESREIIARLLEDCKACGYDEATIKKALHDAYPFGERKYHPYKIWLDEIKRQRGKKWPIGHKVKWQNEQAAKHEDQMKFEEWESLYGRRA
jgi:hypothetical protein